MAIDAYLLLEEGANAIGVKGESQDDEFHGDKGWMRILKVDFGAENETDIGDITGGGGVGKGKLKELTIEKKADSASPGLWQTCVASGHYKKGTINLRKGGADISKSGKTFMEILMLQVLIKEVQWSADEEAVPTESLTLACGAMQVTYWKQDEEGGLATKINPAKWSQNLNIPEFKVKK
jgi:type VI secretion system secreted protein Hcp